jgi:hypothetical protein
LTNRKTYYKALCSGRNNHEDQEITYGMGDKPLPVIHQTWDKYSEYIKNSRNKYQEMGER